jgi:hypothetical protein
MNTYFSMNQNEVRNIELVIRNDDESPFVATSGMITVVDYSGTTITTITCSVSGANSSLIATIPSIVTKTPAEYSLIWKIIKGSSIYYHKTKLLVLEL